MGQNSAPVKIATPLLVLTSALLSILIIQMVIALGALMEALAGGGITVQEVTKLSGYSVGIAGLFWAYWISSAVSSYFIYGAISQHVVEHMRAELCAQQEQRQYPGPYPTSLPSPATALLLTFLTGGLAYIPLFFIADKVIREHIGEKYAAGKVILHVGLFFGTLALSMIYESYSIAEKFNRHSMGAEPPPSTGAESLSAYAAVIGLGIIALHLALTAISRTPLFMLTNVSLGLCWAAFNYGIRDFPVHKRAFANFLFAYFIVIGGFLSGLLVGSIYEDFVKRSLDYLRELRDIAHREDIFSAFITTMAVIFWNNLSISLGGAVPYLGGIPLANGISNAGIVLGFLSRMLRGDLWLVLVYPHSILELAAYAIFITAALDYREPRKFLRTLVIGIIVLALAALVETFQIFLLSL